MTLYCHKLHSIYKTTCTFLWLSTWSYWLALNFAPGQKVGKDIAKPNRLCSDDWKYQIKLKISNLTTRTMPAAPVITAILIIDIIEIFIE